MAEMESGVGDWFGCLKQPNRKHVFLDPAVLKIEIQIKNKITPESDPKSGQNHRYAYGNDSPDPPPDPPGRGITKKYSKNP